MTEINGKPVTQNTIYAECQARGIPFHNHESDLYIPITLETTDLVNHFGHRPTTFTNQVEGGLWYDVPFAYTPWWEAKGVRRSKPYIDNE